MVIWEPGRRVFVPMTIAEIEGLEAITVEPRLMLGNWCGSRILSLRITGRGLRVY